ncbi:hypothetical protein [Brachybacterium sp.]|uniref:hypothetical protein n=1 Tax=Brachybacterium sp. TaxID=1891286 RepID=UPI002ED65CD4
MRNATIATSRTRATTEHLIDYRPLPTAWGDRAALQEVRAAKARVAERGLDRSTLEIAAPSEQHSHSATTRRRRGDLFAALLRELGGHRRPRHSRRHLATA